MKGNIKFELILFYNSNYKPKELLDMGYSKTTVYRYKKYYEKALQKMKELRK